MPLRTSRRHLVLGARDVGKTVQRVETIRRFTFLVALGKGEAALKVIAELIESVCDEAESRSGIDVKMPRAHLVSTLAHSTPQPRDRFAANPGTSPGSIGRLRTPRERTKDSRRGTNTRRRTLMSSCQTKPELATLVTWSQDTS